MNNKTRNFIKIIIFALLLICIVVTFSFNRFLSQKVSSLEAELKEYRDKEGRSFVIQRISEQMEDIAYQQKDISDQQREAAIFQMGVADSMRIRAEIEGHKAKTEQQKAQQYAFHLEEAKNVAEKQRLLAIEQQKVAEHAKNVADTLSYVSLARSLASNSEMQFQSGDKNLSALLAYMSWAITAKYHGNLYYPSIFNALSINSKSFTSKKIHKGGVTKIVPTLHPTTHVSISKYGEICTWHNEGEAIHSQTLVNNPEYDFRDVYIDASNNIYALSYNGRLLKLLPDGTLNETILHEDEQWIFLKDINEDFLLLSSTKALHFFNKTKQEIVRSIALDKEVSAIGNKKGNYIIFFKDGSSSMLNDEGLVSLPTNIPNEEVTAYTWMEQRQVAAAGTASGNIYIIDNGHHAIEKLVGHRSRITHLSFKGQYLYSSSYDHTLNLWDLNTSKKEALTLTTLPSWIYTFSQSKDDNIIWIGDETGSISRILISPNEMGKMVKENLKRDFTDAEWEYFFGSNLPKVPLMIEQ